MAYLIDISEEQRLALIRVLKASPKLSEPELEYWVEMLEELPDVEKNHTGARPLMHGFCY